MTRYAFSKKADLHLTSLAVGILILLFVVTRILFMRADAVFFDSPEYLERIANPSLIAALSQGHLPLHSGYVLMLWPFYHIGQFLHVPDSTILIPQIILSTLGIIVFYITITHLFNKKIALLASLFASLAPLWWIMSVTITMESVYIPFFLFSLFFTVLLVRQQKLSWQLLAAAVFTFGYAFFTHFGIILWAPMLLYLVYSYRKHYFLLYFLLLGSSIALFSVITAYLISFQTNLPIFDSLVYLYTGKLNERGAPSISIIYFLQVLRNIVIPLLRMNTILLTLVGVVGIFILWRIKKNLAVLMMLWIIPVVIANQWWDSLFFGRHTLPATFAFCALSAFVVIKKPMHATLLILYVLITVLPAIALLKQPIPYLELSRVSSQLPQNALYIESHFARPHIERSFSGETIFVDEPGWNKASLKPNLINALSQRRPIYISSQALSEPYGLYSGPYLHPLSLSYAHEYILEDVMHEFSFNHVAEIGNEIDLYEIVSYSPSSYPITEKKTFDRRRVDYSDPIIQLWRYALQQFQRLQRE